MLGIDKLIVYLKPSIEDNVTKQASAKRLTALLITTLYSIGHYHIFKTNTDSNLLFKILILDFVFILLLFGILTTQDLLTALKLKNNQKTDENDSK